jgi:Domain of unknown function (DUF4294)
LVTVGSFRAFKATGMSYSAMKNILIVLALFLSYQGSGQKYVALDSISTLHFNTIIYDIQGDTVFYTTWAAVNIEETAVNRKKKQKYDRLMQKVIKVYPYAQAAGEVMHQCEEQFKVITDEKQQKELLDLAEEEMKKEFEKDLRSLTISEGVILIKLIDRQTGDTSFDLIRQLKGRFSAFMWQSVARLFGHNLKDDYDPTGDDIWIENIVEQIENGDIPVNLRYIDPFLVRQLAKH